MNTVLEITAEGRAQALETIAFYQRAGLPITEDLRLRAGLSVDAQPDVEAIERKARAEAITVAKAALANARAGGSGFIAAPLTFLDTVDAAPVDWLWKGYLPLAKFAILDGDAGVGKSTIAIDIAARLSRGDVMPDGSAGLSGATLFASTEDGLADTLRPRLDAARANPARVAVVPNGLTLPDDIEALRQYIESSGARLVVFDPLFSAFSGRVKANSDPDVRKALGPLAQLAEDTGCTILGIRHFRKAETTNALYRGGGSIGIISQARVGLAVSRDPDDEDLAILSVVKSNLGPMPVSQSYRLTEWTGTAKDGRAITSSRVAWQGPSEKSAADLLAVQDGRTSVVRERPHAKAGQALRSILTEAGPLAAKEALDRLQDRGFFYVLTGSNVQALKAEAGITSQRVRGPDGPFYQWALVEYDA